MKYDGAVVFVGSKFHSIIYMDQKNTNPSNSVFRAFDPSSSIKALFDLSVGGEDVGVTLVEDGHGRASEELTTGSTKLNVVTGEVVNVALGKHSVILELGLAERGGVSSNDDKLGLPGAKGLQRGLVAENILSGLDNKRKARVNGVGCLLGLLGGHLCTSVGLLLKARLVEALRSCLGLS